VRLGVLAWSVGRPAHVADYAAVLDARIAEAAPRADLLLMPEYACMELAPALAREPGAARQLTAMAAEPSTVVAELAAMVAEADAVLAAMRAAARRHAVWLQPGTLPMRLGGRVVNRAPLIRPDGSMAFQDKWHMTRFEAEEWGVTRGRAPSVFPTPWGLIGISICYDCEFPKHVRAQVEAGAWLVLVPTCTDTPHGFSRVAISARARAVENQCFLAVAPTVGAAPWSAALDENRGAAAIYGPADRGFPEDGVIAQGPMDTPGWVFAELEEAAITAVREHGQVRNHRDWPRTPMPRVMPAGFS
jgi:predicted amidohydrolase